MSKLFILGALFSPLLLLQGCANDASSVNSANFQNPDRQDYLDQQPNRRGSNDALLSFSPGLSDTVVDPESNETLFAVDAGVDQFSDESLLIKLNGRILEQNLEQLSVGWVQTAGPRALILSEFGQETSVVLPAVESSQALEFSFWARGANESVAFDSQKVYVSPIASAISIANADSSELYDSVEVHISFSQALAEDTELFIETVGVSATSEQDFVPLNESKVVPAGANSTSWTIDILGDDLAEADEYFYVRISAPGLSAQTQTGTVVIWDDDQPNRSFDDTPEVVVESVIDQQQLLGSDGIIRVYAQSEPGQPLPQLKISSPCLLASPNLEQSCEVIVPVTEEFADQSAINSVFGSDATEGTYRVSLVNPSSTLPLDYRVYTFWTENIRELRGRLSPGASINLTEFYFDPAMANPGTPDFSQYACPAGSEVTTNPSPEYFVQPLTQSSLDEIGSSYDIKDFNNNRQILFQNYTRDGFFLWQSGQVTPVNGIDESDGVLVISMNNSGVLVGELTRNSDMGQRIPVMWRDGVVTQINIDDIGLDTGWAYGINDNDQVVGYGWNGSNYQSYLWDNGQIQTLTDNTGQHDSLRALSINDAGVVLGGASSSSNLQKVFYWQNGQFQIISVDGVVDRVRPNVELINDFSEVLLTYNNQSYFGQPDNLRLVEGLTVRDFSNAYGLVGVNAGSAVIWNDESGVRGLNQLVDTSFEHAACSDFVAALKINDDGAILVEGNLPVENAVEPLRRFYILEPIRILAGQQ